jgi:hypothetical protein
MSRDFEWRTTQSAILSTSPHTPTNTISVNAISNQPQTGTDRRSDEIEANNTVGVRVVEVCCLVTSVALMILEFARLFERKK